jgi:excisionase family DNA binding protein
MDAADAAELLRVPSTWLLMAARDGRVPHHRIGRYVRFDLDELRTWLDETRVPMGRRPRKP